MGKIGAEESSLLFALLGERGRGLGKGLLASPFLCSPFLLQIRATRACAFAGVRAAPNVVAKHLLRAEGEVHAIAFY